MFPFFKKSEKKVEITNVIDTEVGVASKVETLVAPKQPKYPAIVNQIHGEFMGAGDKLLQDSLGILNECTVKDIEKGKRLRALGFTNAPQVQEAIQIETKMAEAEHTAKLVHYYSMQYPNNKFITNAMILEICNKYNLIFGNIDRYTGFVPEKNLSEIEKFKIRKDDEGIGFSNGFFFKNAVIKLSQFDSKYYHIFENSVSDKSHYSYQSTDGKDFYGYDKKNIFGKAHLGFQNHFYLNTENLMICAPLHDMKIGENERISTNRTIERIPDPVVCKQVDGGYLIVTAWGDEASDEVVVNQKFN